jgi:ATP-dependent DNA helicase RecG
MIVIEDAERFGLSQLHQLRGRVGRGSREGVCVLLASPEGEEAIERLRLLTKIEDGFSVAEADLRLRGPGSVCGTRQHGITNYRVADLVRDKGLLEKARLEAQRLQAGDPLLEVRTWFSGDEDYSGSQEPPLLG